VNSAGGTAAPGGAFEFLSGGGEMGALTRAHDWAASLLGAPETWPQPLRTLVSLMLCSRQAMFVAWGPQRVMLYNDGYAAILGQRHPAALGQTFVEVWFDILETVGPILEKAYAGESTHMDDIRLVMHRHGYPEETHFSFSYTPVRDESGVVAGMFCACAETTETVLAERRLANERERQRQVEQELRESEEHYRHAAELNPQVAWTAAPDGQLDRVAERWRRWTGTSGLGDSWGLGLHPDDLGYTTEAWRRSVSTGVPYDVEHRVRMLDGGYRWARSRAFPRRDPEGRIVKWYGSTEDIHERRCAQEELERLNATLEQQVAQRTAELQESRSLLRTMFETSFQYQGLIALDGTLLDANATSLQGINGVREEVVGRPFWQLPWFSGTPGMPEFVRDAAAAVAKGATWREEILVNLPTGWRWFDFAMRPMRDEGGEIVAIIPEAVETTQRHHAEEALRQSQKLEAMGQLTGGVAHDFNNLLTPIIGSLDMLHRRGLGGAREQRLIEGALQAADRAKILVQRLLAFARRQPLQPASVDIGRLITGIADLVESTTGPQIAVHVEQDDALPPAIADANQLEMAILNLAVNARDAMPDGGTLRISASSVEVGRGHRSKLMPGSYVRLSVADTGCGMDDATLARAIEPFFSTKGIGKGTGLGLSMVHGLASQLGGALTLSSAPGLGTNVELWLPVSAAPAERIGGSEAASPGPKGIGTALLVDDEDIVRASTADMLTELGYEVVEASSADEALRLLDRGMQANIVVTDHLMPGMSGVDLARAVRGKWPRMPVLIVSGFAEVGELAPDLPRLTKPFRQADLANFLAQLSEDRTAG
jgi:PAS domain S-box-containing protein